MKRLITTLGMCLSITLAVAGPAHALRLRNMSNPSMCLGVAASNVTNGTPIITYQCDGTPNQDWSWTGTRWTNGANPNKCLTYNFPYQGQVIIWDCDTANSQTGGGADWTLEYAHANIPGFDGGMVPCIYVRESNLAFTEVLGVAGGPKYVKNGGWTMLWDQLPGSDHDDQKWCLN